MTDSADDAVPDERISIFRGEGWFEWGPEMGDNGSVQI